MDANKFAVLQETYEVWPCCALCVHGDFPLMSDWGTCKVLTYQHGKHTGPDRQLSISRFGHCLDNFEPSEPRLDALGVFRVLFVDDPR